MALLQSWYIRWIQIVLHKFAKELQIRFLRNSAHATARPTCRGQAPEEHIDELLGTFEDTFSVIRRAYYVQGSTLAVVHAVASG